MTSQFEKGSWSLAPPLSESLDYDTAHHAALTPREVEVLTMVSKGLLARTIAARLAISPRTVHKHLENVYRKLGDHDRLIAVRHAESLGVISSDFSVHRGA
jgi:DNA-binding NarL/FixJ family response regulator